MQAKTTRKRPAAPRKKAAPVPEPETIIAVEEPLQEDLTPTWLTAIHAAEDKQAIDIQVLDLRGITTMADTFFICNGRNPRQNQAICDEIEQRLKDVHGERPMAIEGLKNAEWVLMDYGYLVIHIFSEAAREYYDLGRLYRDAHQLRAAVAEGQ